MQGLICMQIEKGIRWTQKRDSDKIWAKQKGKWCYCWSITGGFWLVNCIFVVSHHVWIMLACEESSRKSAGYKCLLGGLGQLWMVHPTWVITCLNGCSVAESVACIRCFLLWSILMVFLVCAVAGSSDFDWQRLLSWLAGFEQSELF
jgi:hypothetical protein